MRVSLRNLSARLAWSESCYEICFCETHKEQFSLWNFIARLTSRESRYKISVCETREKRFSLLILTLESHENLARILGLKSESRFSLEFQKVILVSTLLYFWPTTSQTTRIVNQALFRKEYVTKSTVYIFIVCELKIINNMQLFFKTTYIFLDIYIKIVNSV
jgi:hypothetical protein